MLAERTDYLSAGVHIGMKSCTKYLRQFVYKIRDDGLAVFNLRKVDARIVTAANFLSQFENILVVSRKNNAAEAIEKFAEVTGSKAIAGRFSPGTLTNPSYRHFFEPDVVVSVDPLVDENAIKESRKKRIPMVALCDTFNEASDVDLLIPANNNGKKALALIFMLLARELLKKRGKIKKDSEFKYTIEDFGGEGTPAQADEEKSEDAGEAEEEEPKTAESSPKQKDEVKQNTGPAKSAPKKTQKEPEEKAAPKKASKPRAEPAGNKE
jgi:small subunit ribosomal protein S2